MFITSAQCEKKGTRKIHTFGETCIIELEGAALEWKKRENAKGFSILDYAHRSTPQ